MKRLFTLVAASIFAVSTFAQMDVWDGSSDVWTKGAGTEESPYQIENAEQLAFISEMVNAGVTTYENTYFKLMTNMDLNNLTWVPIGSSVTNCFKGHLDGNNKTIFNNSVALFGYITDATINRLNVEIEGIVGKKAMQSTITNCQYSGHRAMICQAEQTTIRNCKSHVEIDNTDVMRSAGLIDSTYQCLIEDCYIDGEIKSLNRRIYPAQNYVDYNAYRQQISTGGITALSLCSKYIRCHSNCIISALQDGSSSISGANYGAGIIGISCMDTLNYCGNSTSALGAIQICYYGTYNIVSNPVQLNCGIIGVNATDGKSQIMNSYTVNDSIYAKGASDVKYSGNTGALEKYCNFAAIPTITNSYSSQDKTEQAMKSASFPIILNAGGNVFMKDVTPNVNNGYPIFVDQVYAISDRPNSIDFTKAELAGHFYAQNADSIGFEYKTLGDNTHWYNSVTVEGENSISYELENLSVGTEYTYRLWVEREGVRYYGDTINFKTLECSKEITLLSATICAGEEYSFAGKLLTIEDIYHDTLTAVNGCDSIVELTLTVNPTIDIEKKDTISEGENYDFYGEILSETGDYYHYIPMGNKCNRVVLHLFVGSSATRVENIEEISTPKKLIRDGQIFILHEDKTFTLQGQEVK